jgi:transposase
MEMAPRTREDFEMPQAKSKRRSPSGPQNGSAKRLIRKVRQATRRRYSAEEKIRIVMEGIRGDDSVSDLCRREGISSNVYYKWLKEFMEAGKARLKGDEKRDATRAEVEDLKRENERLKVLVAEVSVENMVLKKSLL